MQKFDIRSDSFLTETACNLQFKLEVKNIFTCIQRADKERFKRLAKQSFDYGLTHHGSHTQLQLSHTRIQSLLTLDVAKMIGHSIVSSRLDYANALLHSLSVYNITGCRWRKIRWSGQFVKPLGQPVPPSCVVSFTGCKFDSGFSTRSLSSPTRHVPPANQLTSLTSCKTTDQPIHASEHCRRHADQHSLYDSFFKFQPFQLFR